MYVEVLAELVSSIIKPLALQASLQFFEVLSLGIPVNLKFVLYPFVEVPAELSEFYNSHTVILS